MKLYFKQHFSILDNYSIFDEEGNTVFTVKSKFSIGHKMIVYNAYGEEIGMIVQRLLHLHPTFEIWINGQLVGTIRKEITLFRPKFNLSFGDYHVEGNFMEWDYTVTSAGRPIMTVKKELFHITDHYIIDVFYDSQLIPAVMIVLAIDAEKCSRR